VLANESGPRSDGVAGVVVGGEHVNFYAIAEARFDKSEELLVGQGIDEFKFDCRPPEPGAGEFHPGVEIEPPGCAADIGQRDAQARHMWGGFVDDWQPIVQRVDKRIGCELGEMNSGGLGYLAPGEISFDFNRIDDERDILAEHITRVNVL